MNQKILFILTFFLFRTTFSAQQGDRITVDWIYSDEAREIAAVHRYHWLDNNTAILFDVRQPKEERTFLKLDPQKPSELKTIVDREKAILSLQTYLGEKDSSKFLMWPIAFNHNGMQALYIYKNDIFILDMENSEFIRITKTETIEKSPRFSPDGS